MYFQLKKWGCPTSCNFFRVVAVTFCGFVDIYNCSYWGRMEFTLMPSCNGCRGVCLFTGFGFSLQEVNNASHNLTFHDLTSSLKKTLPSLTKSKASRFNTVDGRNPAPLGMYKTLKTPVNNGMHYQPQLVTRISEPSTVLNFKGVTPSHESEKGLVPGDFCITSHLLGTTAFPGTTCLGTIEKNNEGVFVVGWGPGTGGVGAVKKQLCLFQ